MELNKFRDVMFGLSLGFKWKPDFADDARLKVWFSSFNEVPLECLEMAARLALDTLDEFPSVRQLKALCNGMVQDAESIGQEIANKIGEAIGNPGGYQPVKAKSILGDLAWAVVERHGGWWDLCNLETVKELNFLKRDMAKTAKNIYLEHQAFGHEKTIGLPTKNGGLLGKAESRPEILTRALNIVKRVN